MMGYVVAPAGQQLYRTAIEARMHAVAIEFDLVQPPTARPAACRRTQ
jgi:hypothetical protein